MITSLGAFNALCYRELDVAHLSMSLERQVVPDASAAAVAPTLSISVVIPVYNGGEQFHACLGSLARTVPPPDEIVVVADGDTDGSRDHARATGVQVIVLAGPGGPARARNAGARAARGDILFFVDADVTVPPDAMRQIQAAFRGEPDLAALIGSYDDTPADPHFLSQYKNLLHHYTHQQGRDDASTFWGACGAIRRDVFLRVGGFDERYTTPAIEDIELGYRLVRQGYKIRLRKELQIKHLKRWTVASLLRSDFFGRALPWTELIMREQHMQSDLNLSLSSRLSVACVYGLLAAFVLAPKRLPARALAGVLTLALLGINAPVYRFFVHKRGWWFAARAIPWHWLYYFYSGLAFVIGSLRFHPVLTAYADCYNHARPHQDMAQRGPIGMRSM